MAGAGLSLGYAVLPGLHLGLAAPVCFGLGAYFSPGSGYGVGATAVAGCLTVGISKVRTGKWFTDEAGGH